MGAFFLDGEALRKADEKKWLSTLKQASWLENHRAKLLGNKIAKLMIPS
jgi:hypothetical protein